MKKLSIISAALIGLTASAAENFDIGFSNDILSAYVWRNAIVTDEMVWQPFVWADYKGFDPFYVGFNVCQNWDFTGNRSETMPRAMNESDFNVHIGATAWKSEDESMSLGLELGHDWYTYRTKHDVDMPTVDEFYFKSTFNNPIVNPYFQYSQAYEPIRGGHFLCGLNRSFEIWGPFSAGLDWNIGFATGDYGSYNLYGVEMSDGVTGTTLKGNLTYQILDWLSISAVVAYTSVLNGEARDGLSDAGVSCNYRELVWGGLSLVMSY